MNKSVILLVIALALIVFVGLGARKSPEHTQASSKFPISKTDAQWKEELSPQAYQVLRQHSTERPNTSPLNLVEAAGDFTCVGCGNLLFKTEHKFDSGTGWPSFYQPASQDSVGSSTDYKLVYPRTEVHCARCGGHLGHVFSDGPKPTGKRYCINGVCLEFQPEE